MLHAAAMLIGLCIVWLLATQRWSSGQDLAIAGVAGLACVFVGARLGGVAPAFAQAPRLALLAVARSGATLGGALAAIRAACAADITLKPGLVRVKTRARLASERVAFADLISATPGMVVVESDAEGFLVHALNEDEIDAADLGRLERMAVGAASTRATA